MDKLRSILWTRNSDRDGTRGGTSTPETDEDLSRPPSVVKSLTIDPSSSLTGFDSILEKKDIDLAKKDRSNTEHSNNDVQTIINLFKSNFGPGFLSLPLAVKNAGIVVGVLGLVVIGAVATHGMLLLLEVANGLYKRGGVQTLNYAQVARNVVTNSTGKKRLGKFLGVLVNIFLILSQFGYCTVYLVFLAENLREVFCTAFNVHLDRRIWIVIILLPVILSTSIKELDSMVPYCVISNILLVYCLGAILYAEFFALVTKGDEQAAILKANTTVKLFPGPRAYNTLPLFFSSAIYAYESVGMVLPLENKMKKPSHAKAVFNLTFGITIAMFVVFGVLGYVVYGDEIQGSVTLNLTSKRIGAITAFLLVKLFFSYIVFISFMLQFYVPLDFLEPIFYNDILKAHRWQDRFPRHHHILKFLTEAAFRTTLVLLIAVAALILPDLQDLITLIGAVAVTLLGLVLPPMLHILCFWEKRRRRKWFQVLPWPIWVTKDVLIILVGVAGMLLGLYSSLHNIVENFLSITTHHRKCTVYYEL